MTFRIGSELIFNGLRAAIKVEEIDIYNIRFYYDDYEVLVDSYGRVPYWPEPMFVHSNKFLSILL
jgi:hypothetical protein